MAATVRRSFELSKDQADLIDRKVSQGEFASADEVVQAGLAALAEHDAVVERWLREEVVPVVEDMKAHPERGIPAKQVFDEIRALAKSRMERDSDAA